jgi:hypothetical protein
MRSDGCIRNKWHILVTAHVSMIPGSEGSGHLSERHLGGDKP